MEASISACRDWEVGAARQVAVVRRGTTIVLIL